MPARVFLPGWGSAGAPGTIRPGVEVVGWSLGAARALEAATQMELAGLVLISATPQFIRRDGWRHGWPPRVLERMRARLRTDPEGLLDEFAAGLFAPGEEPVAVPRESDVEVLDAGLAYLGGFSVLDRLDEITCPVRLLHGRLDAVIPLAAAEHVAAVLPHADLTVWDEVGHAPHLTQPIRFIEWLD